MQKKIIAMLVAGLVSGVAYAQTNVTVYGRADLGYTYSKSDYRKFQGVESGQGIGGGASRIGLMGEENLGNGLKAVFKFEWGVAADMGTGPIGERYTYAGLAGSFGNVLFGRNGTASDYYLGATGVMGINGYEPINLFRGKMPLMDGGQRWNNSITYNSPNFSGFDFMAIYSFGEQTNGQKNAIGYGACSIALPGAAPINGPCESSDTSDAGRFGIGVRYANGPLYLTALYHTRADDDGARIVGSPVNTGFGAKGWAVGGTYDFKVVKLYANYVRLKANDDGWADFLVDGGSDKQTTWSLGIGIPVSGAGTVVAEYAQYKDYLNYGARDIILGGINNRDVGRAGHKAKGYSVGYKHVLSKRTSLYTYVSRIDNDRGINAGWGGGTANGTGVAGEDQTNFSIGILHLF
jgi:predicted porin